MLYSQQQALAVLRIDQSTFVYWMRAIPRIQRLKGRGCRFERADLLALGVFGHLTHELGIGIGRLEPLAESIFELLRGAGEATDRAIVIEQASARMERLPTTIIGPTSAAIVPLKPIVDKISAADGRAALLPLERLMFDNGS